MSVPVTLPAVEQNTPHDRVYDFIVGAAENDPSLLYRVRSLVDNIQTSPLVPMDGLLPDNMGSNLARLFLDNYLARMGEFRNYPDMRDNRSYEQWLLYNQQVASACRELLERSSIEDLLEMLDLFEPNITRDVFNTKVDNDALVGFAKRLDIEVDIESDSSREHAFDLLVTALPNYVLATRLNEFLAQK